MKCSPLHSRRPVVRIPVRLSMEVVPNYMRTVFTGDDSGDDSDDEGPGRERDDDDTEGTVSPVGKLVKVVNSWLIGIVIRLMSGPLLLRRTCPRAPRRMLDPLRKPTPNLRRNWQR